MISLVLQQTSVIYPVSVAYTMERQAEMQYTVEHHSKTLTQIEKNYNGRIYSQIGFQLRDSRNVVNAPLHFLAAVEFQSSPLLRTTGTDYLQLLKS